MICNTQRVWLLLAALPFQNALATLNDEAFRDYVNNVVCDSPQGVNLQLTCDAAAVTIGGSGNTLSQTGNTGTQGANELSSRERNPQQAAVSEAERRQFANIGVFSSLDYHNIERDTTEVESGYEGDALVWTLGADYRLSPRWLLGTSLAYGDTDLDYAQNAGATDTERLEWLLFASHQLTDAFYIDAYAGWSQQSSDTVRTVAFGLIQYDAASDVDADGVQWGVATGYGFQLGGAVVDLALRYDEHRTDVDAYEERGGTDILNLNLRYEGQTIDSRTVTLSVLAAYNLSVAGGVLVPYASGELVSEREDAGREVNSQLLVAPDEVPFVVQVEAPDDQYGRVGGGVQFIAPGGVMGFVALESLVSHDYLDVWRTVVGVRGEW